MAQEKGEIARFATNARSKKCTVRQGDVGPDSCPCCCLLLPKPGISHAVVPARFFDIGEVVAYFTLIQLLASNLTSLGVFQISLDFRSQADSGVDES
jgi:hypothetical protein